MRAALLVGNSDGIGLELTRSLLAEGWCVMGISRSESRLSAPNYTHHVVDVCHVEYPTRLTQLVNELGELDVCVYCAGTGEFLDALSMAGERRVFETNLIGAVATAAVVVPTMVRRRSGHFIGLSSQADQLIDAHAPSYAASKAGLSSYLEGLALHCRKHRVFITNLRFGFVDTKLAKAPWRPFMLTTEEAAARIRRCIEQRPIRDTYPKRMAVLLLFFRAVMAVRRWFM
jgi:short-subunit dehydrogenase